VLNLRVDLKKEVDDSYDILIGNGFIAEKIAGYRDKGALFLVDSNVMRLYPSFFKDIDCFVMETSENAKDMESLIEIMSYIKEKGARRDAELVVVGGGITGDVGGFAASAYMRGIKFIQIPTTLLSMVDSSVGGKVAVNFGGAKNNVGAFYQPETVLIDMDFLNTLTDEEYLNGFAEVVKYAFIFDEEFLEYLVDNKEKIIARDMDILSSIVHKCCSIKADVVRQDEKEDGIRKLLNFGHTIGHGIESDSEFGVKHGMAVATGMYIETVIAFKLGHADEKTVSRVEEVLELFGYDKEYNIKNKEVFAAALGADKKASKSGITLALTPKIGTGKIISDIPLKELENLLF